MDYDLHHVLHHARIYINTYALDRVATKIHKTDYWKWFCNER